MTYIRKTRDVFELHVYYGPQYGWEHEISEDTLRDARARQREYRENCPQYPTRIKITRERIEQRPQS
jgi:hypothetical protein